MFTLLTIICSIISFALLCTGPKHHITKLNVVGGLLICFAIGCALVVFTIAGFHIVSWMLVNLP